ELQNRELLGELVEDAEFAMGGRVLAGQLDTSHSVTNIEEPAGLPALPVNGNGMLDGRLHAEAIERGAEYVVVVEAVDKRFIATGLVSYVAVNDPFVKIGGANAPNLAAIQNV